MKLTKSKSLGSNQDGVSVVEFALISPPLMAMLLGAMDIGHSFYTRAVINGALQEAGRSSSLEGAAVESEKSRIDNGIERIVTSVAPSARVEIRRRYYKTFSDAALADAETWTDNNDNGTCDDNEPYIDENNNDTWDEDGGNEGIGGARDVVIITAMVTYDRLFPVQSLLGFSDQVAFESDSILANQPYGEQEQNTTAVVRNCDD